MNPIQVLDYAGVAVFAATGALAASRKQLDIIGFLFLASAAALGGGTFRDLILGVPVFWVANTDYIWICLVVTVAVFFGAPSMESRYKALLWLDAVGLAAFAVMGAAKGLTATGSAPVAVVTGMLTAAFGGVLRDVLANEPSVLLRREIYVSAALAGAATYVVLAIAGVPAPVSALAAFAVALFIRGGALRFGWSLPTYGSRPGRKPEDIS